MDDKLTIEKLIASAYIILMVLLTYSQPAHAERVKDVATLQGVRPNQLIGYGLVVGLDGTGDQTNQAIFTSQSFKSMLNKFGIRIPPEITLQTKNIAAVIVSTDLPPFAKPGQTIDVTVSSIGNAKSLRGGTLLLTPLKGADGQVYGVAQGNLIVSGLGAEGADGSKITVNIPSAGRIPNGATVERPSPTTFSFSETAVYNLHQPDFTTATRLATAINGNMNEPIAKAIDSTSIAIQMPEPVTEQVELLAHIENLKFVPADSSAKVVINSRTGTIVIGQHVRVKPAVVSHGNLVVTVSENPTVSQPEPLSLGTTTVVQDSQVKISEEENRAFLFDPGITLHDIVSAINAVGASPSDLTAILESLKTAGALRAQLQVI